MIYLYALLDLSRPLGAEDLSALPGLQGPLERHDVGGWSLIFSQHDDAEILPKRRLLLTHTRVQEHLLTFGTLLPARFGLIATTIAEVERKVLARSDLLAAEFARVAGCVELGLRIGFARQPALAATLADHADLARRRARLATHGPDSPMDLAEFGGQLADRLDRRRHAAQHQLLRQLVPLARAHVLRKPEADTEVLRAEFLLPSSYVQEFTATAEKAAKALGFAPGAEPELQIVGPAPPYHFVRLSLTSEMTDEAA